MKKVVRKKTKIRLGWTVETPVGAGKILSIMTSYGCQNWNFSYEIEVEKNGKKRMYNFYDDEVELSE